MAIKISRINLKLNNIITIVYYWRLIAAVDIFTDEDWFDMFKVVKCYCGSEEPLYVIEICMLYC